MGLNSVKGNMYEFVTHTWNVVKGKCFHDCSYCYMKKWGPQNPARFDEKELRTDLGSDNFIFVGSSNDMFAENIPTEWIQKVINHCNKYENNRYLLQTKNPKRFLEFELDDKFILGTTIESNRIYLKIYGNSPDPQERLEAISSVSNKTFITIEPILDFDLEEFSEMLKSANPEWINIGADSGGHSLPEPNSEEIYELIERLSFSEIELKRKLKRLNKT
jgi:DNA repair photolyase